MVARVQGPFATRAVEGTRFTDVRRVDETGSTNRDLLVEAVAGAPEGRRAGRRPPDRRPRSTRPLVVRAAGLLVARLGAAASGARARRRPSSSPPPAPSRPARRAARWPRCSPGSSGRTTSSIVAGERFAGRKLAGILAESVVTEGRIRAIVLGMGLNVNWPDGLPAELGRHGRGPRPRRRPPGRPGGDAGQPGCATSMAGSSSSSPPDGRACSAGRGPGDVGHPRAAPSGSSCPTGTVEGVALDITPAGHLLVLAGGRRRSRSRCRSGDVVHLRHAATEPARARPSGRRGHVGRLGRSERLRRRLRPWARRPPERPGRRSTRWVALPTTATR